MLIHMINTILDDVIEMPIFPFFCRLLLAPPNFISKFVDLFEFAFGSRRPHTRFGGPSCGE
jgi:hypothetical protein